MENSFTLPLSAHLRAALEDIAVLRQAGPLIEELERQRTLERVERSIGHVLHLVGGEPHAAR